MQISGFQFDHSVEGRKVIRIRADEFTVEKMKLGHFSLGIVNVAKLKNGVIEVYGESAKKTESPGSGPASKADPNPAGGVSKEPTLTFDNLFKEESMPSFGTKKVASIVIEPIRVQLRDQDTVLVQITAASASLKLKNREIQFKGNVRLSANQHSLEAEEMSFHPENGRIKVEGDYILQSAKGRIQGKRLETDVLLKETRLGSSKLKN
jgi:lipopolysaccharide export system protein LptA